MIRYRYLNIALIFFLMLTSPLSISSINSITPDKNANSAIKEEKLKLILNTPDYIITPGDRFLFEYSGRSEVLLVDFNHLLTGNAFGSIDITGLTLTKLYLLIKEKIKEQLGKYVIYKFEMIDYGIYSIPVKGEINRTQVINGCGIDRLDYYVVNADITAYASMRKIKVTHNGQGSFYDLFLYYFNGDITQNPVIFPQDTIEILKKDREIGISGSVKKSGKYELLPAENIDDLIRYAHGLTEEAYLELTRINRILTDDGSQYTTFYLNLKKEESFQLKHRDEVFIYDRSYLQPIVFVEGAVKGLLNNKNNTGDETINPGEKCLSFRFNSGERILDILNRAGGLYQNADLKNAYIVRVENGDTIFKIDLAGLLYKNDLRQNIEILNQDKLVIPVRQNQIGVLGMVKNPRDYPFEQNRSALYYIQKAGGVIPINGNDLFFWLIKKSKPKPERYAMGKADTILLQAGDIIEIRPSGLYWMNNVYPAINNFLSLGLTAGSLILNIADYYDTTR